MSVRYAVYILTYKYMSVRYAVYILIYSSTQLRLITYKIIKCLKLIINKRNPLKNVHAIHKRVHNIEKVQECQNRRYKVWLMQ